MKRIPFDSLTLAAVLAEVKTLLGGKCQRVLQPTDSSLALAIYSSGTEHWVQFDCDAEFARLHRIKGRPSSPAAGEFGRLVRSKLDGARLLKVEQTRRDRIATLTFSTADGEFRLICELMGKHSNLILVTQDDVIVACAKPVGITKSKRPVLVGRKYAPPPLDARNKLESAQNWAELKSSEGVSPFLEKLLRAAAHDDFESGKALALTWFELAKKGSSTPFVAENGAYPVSLTPVGIDCEPTESIGLALAETFGKTSESAALEHRKQALASQLERVLLSREAAVHDLLQVADAAKNAASIQMKGELILAYQWQIQDSDEVLEAPDYEGNPVQVRLFRDKTPLENAEIYFQKAKRAKSNAPLVADQLARFQSDISDLSAAIARLAETTKFIEIDEIAEQARAKRWLHVQTQSTSKRQEQPFEGHKIKSVFGPNNFTILYGENATSNDYLTLRVAKPNDWWLHVRGATSAHVIIQTHNQPQKVGPEVLRFAAEVAVKNSSMKHSAYVPVDYTLKKYVRKPKGAAVGSAIYSHEKTMHVG